MTVQGWASLSGFKRGQVELARYVIQVGAGRHAFELLVVGRVVLQRTADALIRTAGCRRRP